MLFASVVSSVSTVFILSEWIEAPTVFADDCTCVLKVHMCFESARACLCFYLCACIFFYIFTSSFFFFTLQGPSGLPGAKGEKVNYSVMSPMV